VFFFVLRMKRLKHFNQIGFEVLTAVVAYYLTLKMEAKCSSETSADFQLIAWRYIPEGRLLILTVFTRTRASCACFLLLLGLLFYLKDGGICVEVAEIAQSV
jgi:hypothetical protein